MQYKVSIAVDLNEKDLVRKQQEVGRADSQMLREIEKNRAILSRLNQTEQREVEKLAQVYETAGITIDRSYTRSAQSAEQSASRVIAANAREAEAVKKYTAEQNAALTKLQREREQNTFANFEKQQQERQKAVNTLTVGSSDKYRTEERRIQDALEQSAKKTNQLTSETDRLIAKNQQAIKTFETLEPKVARTYQSFDTGVRKLEQSSTSLTSELTGMAGEAGVVAGGLLAVGSAAYYVSSQLTAMVEEAIQVGSHFHDMSIQTGLSVETLSGLENQLRQSHATVDEFDNGVFRLQRNLRLMAEGNKDLRSTFGKLGITDANAALSDMDGTVRKVLKGLSAIPDEGKRNAAGAQIMGNAYRQLSVFVEDLNGDVDGAIAKSRELGTVMSGQTADALDRLGDRMDELRLKLERVRVEVGTRLLDSTDHTLSFISELLEKNGRDWSTWSGTILNSIATVSKFSSLLFFGPSSARIAQDTQQNVMDIAGQAVKNARKKQGQNDDFEFSPRERGGTGAADRATQAAIRAAEIDLRAAERVNKETTAMAQREFDTRQIALDGFVKKQIASEEMLKTAKLAALATERAEAEKLSKGYERATKLKDIGEKEKQIISETTLREQQIRDDAARKELDALAQQREIILGTIEAFNKRDEDAIRAAGEAGLLSREATERAVADLEWQAHEQRSELLRDDLQRAGINLEEQKRIKLELAKSDAEYAVAFAESQRRITAARKQDIEEARKWAQQINDLEIEARLSSFDNARSQLDLMEKIGVGSNKYLQQQRDALDYQVEIQRGLQEKLDLIRKQAEFDSKALNPEMRAKAEEVFRQQQEAAEEAHQLRLEDIRLRPLERYTEKLRAVANDVVDVFGNAFDSIFEKGESFWKTLEDGFKHLFIDIVKGYFLSGVRSVVESLFGLNRPTGAAQTGTGNSGGGILGVLGGIFGGLFGRGKPTVTTPPFAGGSIPGISFNGLAGAGMAGFGFGLPSSGTLFDTMAMFGGSDLTTPQSLSAQAAQQSQLSSLLGQATQGGLGGLLKGGFSFSGLGASLAPMLPLAGLGLGAGLGGGSGLSGILGGAGGLLAGGIGAALLAPGLFGIVPGAVTVTGSASAAFSAGLYGFLTNPFTIAAAGALLIGAYLLNKKKQRDADERTRTQLSGNVYNDTITVLNALRAGTMSGADGLAQYNQIGSTYLAQAAQLKDSKTRRIAQQWWYQDFNPYWQPVIQQAAKDADEAKKRGALLQPEFRNGGSLKLARFADGGMMSAFAMSNFVGRVPGYYDRADDKLIRVSGDETVLTPYHVQALGGARAMRAAGVPGYQNGANLAGGSGDGSGSLFGDVKVTVNMPADGSDIAQVVLEVMDSRDGGKVIERKVRSAKINRRL